MNYDINAENITFFVHTRKVHLEFYFYQNLGILKVVSFKIILILEF